MQLVGSDWVALITADPCNGSRDFQRFTVEDQHDIDEHKNQEGGIDFPAAPQRTHHDRAPTLLGQSAAICQHTGVAGHEHKDFGGVAEAVVTQRQPAQHIVWNMIDEDEPEG
jgi:hypothetical protein